MEQVVRLIAAALETSSLEMSLVYGKKTLDALFNSKFVEDTIALCEILRMRNWTYYPKLIMPKILR